MNERINKYLLSHICAPKPFSSVVACDCGPVEQLHIQSPRGLQVYTWQTADFSDAEELFCTTPWDFILRPQTLIPMLCCAGAGEGGASAVGTTAPADLHPVP